jgi:hypothetical protein
VSVWRGESVGNLRSACIPGSNTMDYAANKFVCYGVASEGVVVVFTSVKDIDIDLVYGIVDLDVLIGERWSIAPSGHYRASGSNQKIGMNASEKRKVVYE